MKRNMGIADRVIRLCIAFVFAVLVLTNVIPEVWSIPAMIITGAFVFTSLIGLCPLYTMLDITTISGKE